MSVKKENAISVETTEANEVVIQGTISDALLEKHTKDALEFFKNNLSIDGFRKGNIPEAIIRKNVSEIAFLEEVALRALNEIYSEVIKEDKLDIFGRPQVNFTKLAVGNPVEFSIVSPLMPKIDLADYKEIAANLNAKKAEIVLGDDEVDNALLEIRRELDRRENISKETETDSDTTETPEKQENKKEAEPSPLTDEKVQTISPAKTVEEFRGLVSEDLKKHKENQADEKHRLEILEAILEKSSVTIPDSITESELEGMKAQFAQDIMQAGLNMDDYLKQAGKTEEELTKEWRPQAEKRAKMQLILNKIATEENLFPKKEDIDHQVSHILEHDPKIDKGRVEVYVETQLANANVFTFLAEQK